VLEGTNREDSPTPDALPKKSEAAADQKKAERMEIGQSTKKDISKKSGVNRSRKLLTVSKPDDVGV
jgi:hypothetical protein